MNTVLPVLNRPLDNTALGAYMACPREYFLSMVLHRRHEGKKPALAYGSVMHKLLEGHYSSGGSVALAEDYARDWWSRHGVDEPGEHRNLERAILDYKRYRERWGQKPEQEQGTTIGWPDEPMVEIPFNIKGGDLINPWAGKLDRIIELGGMYYVEDHKTTSRLDKNFYDSFELDNQMMGYTWAGRLLIPTLRIQGVRLNVIHILKEKTGFERQIFTYTREQIAEWESNINEWTQLIMHDQETWPTFEELKEGAKWPRAHFGKDGCSRKYGMCGYHKLCSVAPSFRAGLLEEFPVNEWDPMNVDGDD